MRVDEHAVAIKLAMNESVFRTANDHLRGAALSHHFKTDQRVPFICECSDPGCRETVMLCIDEYEHIRAHPTWFLLVAGHEDEDSTMERIVDAESGYAVVEKIGVAGEEATRLSALR
jgi:hypothetical protein